MHSDVPEHISLKLAITGTLVLWETWDDVSALDPSAEYELVVRFKVQ